MINNVPFLFLFVKEKRFRLNDILLPNGMEHIIKKTSSGGTCAVGVEEKANAISSRLLFKKSKTKNRLEFLSSAKKLSRSPKNLSYAKIFLRILKKLRNFKILPSKRKKASQFFLLSPPLSAFVTPLIFLKNALNVYSPKR